ncbi:hypothetical protein LY474_36395 [Myxococcus stipitatus]|uniref:hypothetical protein n=1 Tax=Myxococcus stipitatus TaxID=83455 RepID=UPI001F3427D9|nr:hypothetical protein [Myxococcus stipitatus]MCE9673303.1 hypothetical protein [Myxococcus stipitatus]
MNAVPTARTLLGHALLVDGLASGATGALSLFGANPLGELLNLPPALLRGAGAGLLPFAALLVVLALRPLAPRGLVWGIVALNVLWTVDSFALLASGWVQPNVWGQAFVAFQALAVAVFAGLEMLGLKQARLVAA